MPFDAPFILGPFVVDHTGRMTPDAGGEPTFWLTWRGRAVHVAMCDLGAGAGRLTMRLTLGRIPSTALASRADTRSHAFAMARFLSTTALPDPWRATLLADHRIVMEADAELPLPASAGALVTALTLFLLTVDPYLRLVEEAGLGLAVPLEPAGKANIWPG